MLQNAVQGDSDLWISHQQAHEQVFAGIAGRHFWGEAVDGVLKFVGVELVLDIEWISAIDLQESSW